MPSYCDSVKICIKITGMPIITLRFFLLHNSPGSDYLDGEPEVQETVAPAENHVQHQDPLEYKAGNVIYDETHPEEHIPSFLSSTDMKRDSPIAPPHPPSSPTLEEPVEEAPKTYASVVSKYML